MLRKRKHFFLTVVKAVTLKLSPICEGFDENSCKIHVCSLSSSMPPFWIDFRCNKSLQTSKTLFVYRLSVALAKLAPGLRFFKNLLLRPREKFSKRIWPPRRKQWSNNQNNLTNQPPGENISPRKTDK